MSVWPLLVDVRVVSAERRKVRLWIPAVLLWPLLLVLAVLAFVFTVLADLILLLSRNPYHHSTRLLMWSLGAIAQTRGMKLYIDNDTSSVHVSVR